MRGNVKFMLVILLLTVQQNCAVKLSVYDEVIEDVSDAPEKSQPQGVPSGSSFTTAVDGIVLHDDPDGVEDRGCNIIGEPHRSCGPGQIEDVFGKCRTVFQ
uniref:Uncharacterized protein n=1 Tax=Cuerna arida TaxID=1464854 RepID=A0A1B6EIF3_9HEMI